MGLSLEEYAKAHPMQDPAEREEIAAAGRAWKEKQQEREEAERIKKSVLAAIQRGDDPQLIVYAAVQCIGLYSGDQTFTQEAQACLDSVYSDLMQQSMLNDNTAIAAERLEERRIEYTEKLRRSAVKQIKECESIIESFNNILKTIDNAYLQDIGFE